MWPPSTQAWKRQQNLWQTSSMTLAVTSAMCSKQELWPYRPRYLTHCNPRGWGNLKDQGQAVGPQDHEEVQGHVLRVPAGRGPAHNANVVQGWMEANIKFWAKSYWAPQSPDLNPLDFSIWWHIERKACAVYHSNVDKLKAAGQKSRRPEIILTSNRTPPPQGNLAFAPCMDVSISSSSLRLRFFLTKMYLANSDTCWFTRCSQYLLVQSSIYLLPKHCLYSPAFSVIMASAASLLGHGRRNTAHDERTSLWATQCFPYFLFVIIALPKLHRGVPLSNFNSLSFSRQSKF